MTQALNLANFANFINSSGQANSTTALSGATTGYVPFGASNGSLQYNSNLYFDGTNLGIGTASPDTLLTLVPASNTAYSIHLGGSDYGTSYGTKIYVQNKNEAGTTSTFYTTTKLATTVNGRSNVQQWLSFVADSGSGDYQYWSTAGSERMRINGSGNIGIGTSSPLSGYNLTVANGIAIQNSYPSQFAFVKASYFGYSPSSYQAAVLGTTSGNQTICVGVDPSSISGGSFNGSGAELLVRNVFAFLTPNSGNTDFIAPLRFNNGSVTVPGALSKGSGSFRIEHPLPSLSETHQLVHSFIEGPRIDLIYRGEVSLINGTATINIDKEAGMTEGTFVVLCREAQCFTSNESDWDAVKGSVVGNQLIISCQNTASTAKVSWMVIAERQDSHIINTDWTDENGKVIVEPLKPEEPKYVNKGNK